MIWTVEFDNRARKELRKLDPQTQDRILKWLRQTIATQIFHDLQRLDKQFRMVTM